MRPLSVILIVMAARLALAGPDLRVVHSSGRTDARSDFRSEWTRALGERLADSPRLEENYPELSDIDLSRPQSLGRVEPLLDRLETGAVPGSGLERDAAITKAIESIKAPILDLAGKAVSPETPSNVLLGMAFKLRWQLQQEGLYFSKAEQAKLEAAIGTARRRLTDQENARFDEAMKAFHSGASERTDADSVASVPITAAFRKLSPNVPYLGKRFYDPGAAAALGVDADRTIIWDLNHTGENHKDPYHENIMLRPDFVAALAYGRRLGYRNIIMTQAEQWWVDPFFAMFPRVLDYVHGVIVAENYMGMTSAEKRAHPEVATLLEDRPTGKHITTIGARVIIDEDKSGKLAPLADEVGFKHIKVSVAFDKPKEEGDILLRAVKEAIEHLRSTAAPADADAHSDRHYIWGAIAIMATVAFSFAMLLWYLHGFQTPGLGIIPFTDGPDRFIR